MKQLEPVFAAAQVIASYNLSYDYRLLKQSLRRDYRFPPGASPFCIMETYAAYYGEWNGHFGDYRWQRLDSAMLDFRVEPTGLMHRSLTDTLGALAVLRRTGRKPTAFRSRGDSGHVLEEDLGVCGHLPLGLAM